MLFAADEIQRTRPARWSLDEWRARVELAACYRTFHHRGWSEEIFNHITLRLPGPERHYLINPFGLHYGEVTARNLVKIDLEGQAAEPSEYPVNRAGFIIHGAIHAARDDAHCIMHTHHTAGMAVACKAGGLAMDNFYTAFLDGRIAYHDFEGQTVRVAEQQRLVANLGNKSCLILRNHGLLVAERDLESAFYWLYALQRACEVQVLAHSLPGPTLALTPEALAGSSDVQAADPERKMFAKMFAAAVRSAGITLDELV